MREQPAATVPAGLEGSDLPGPYAVGEYAEALRARLRDFTRVQVFGELWNLRRSKARVYFELRDAHGALPCSMWRNLFDSSGLDDAPLTDGAQVVLAGGCDYYPGSTTASPSFSFDVTTMRVAGTGDLLAGIERMRKQLDAEGLLLTQKALARPALPHTIGVVTGEGGKARDDILAGLARRGWAGRLVWGFAPVQDRHAAPRIVATLRELAATQAIDVIIVARGGGSLADLFAFCDETLCRTVALLPVPVIASVGHHTDRTLIDDVAAVSCSTPTHAAESAVTVHPAQARESLRRGLATLQRDGRRAVLGRAKRLVELQRAPAEHLARHRSRLRQQTRELRAAGGRRVKRVEPERARHRAALLDAHDPERTLERGYVLATDDEGTVVASAAEARAAGRLRLRFSDAEIAATVQDRR